VRNARGDMATVSSTVDAAVTQGTDLLDESAAEMLARTHA